MTIDELEEQIVELIEELEAISLELFARSNAEALCAIYGGVLHGIICSDDTIPEESKAAHVVVMIGRHLTSSAIDHFDTSSLPERIAAKMEKELPEKLH